ncbi:hypothetical protein HMPREF1141_3570 [Clostridium sp. MSTE9]|nr:hypothetical protein HMPREF1141_3570 [Clostridium sp. MSTE9]
MAVLHFWCLERLCRKSSDNATMVKFFRRAVFFPEKPILQGTTSFACRIEKEFLVIYD